VATRKQRRTSVSLVVRSVLPDPEGLGVTSIWLGGWSINVRPVDKRICEPVIPLVSTRVTYGGEHGLHRENGRMSKKPPTINVVVGDRETGKPSYDWRIWWHGPDFYVVPRYAPMSGVKVSLHGPRTEYLEPKFMVGIDHDAMLGASRAGGVAHFPDGRLIFPGRAMAPGVRHVVRLRWTLNPDGVSGGSIL